jgi:hypothetical protein
MNGWQIHISRSHQELSRGFDQSRIGLESDCGEGKQSTDIQEEKRNGE